MKNILDKIISFFRDLSDRQSQSVLGIDISSSSIKLVQLKKKRGKAILQTYGEISLGPYAGTEPGRATKLSVQKTAEALNDLLKEAKTTTINCGVSIPMTASLIKIVEIPFISEKQLKDVVPIEARKYIPVPITEVLLDWRIVPDEKDFLGEEKNEGGKINIMLVAIHKEIVSMFQEIVEKVGLQTTFFEIEIFSAARSILDRGIKPVLVFDFGASTTKLYIVERGIVQVSHIINRGSQDITLAISKSFGMSIAEAEEIKRNYGIRSDIGADITANNVSNTSAIIEYIFSETEQMVIEYQTKNNKVISEIVLTGGGSLLKGLQEMAQDRLKILVTMANPFKKVETPAFLEDLLQGAGPEFAVAVGVALRKLEEEG